MQLREYLSHPTTLHALPIPDRQHLTPAQEPKLSKDTPPPQSAKKEVGISGFQKTKIPVGVVNKAVGGEARAYPLSCHTEGRESLSPCGLLTQNLASLAGHTGPSWSAFCHRLGLGRPP